MTRLNWRFNSLTRWKSSVGGCHSFLCSRKWDWNSSSHFDWILSSVAGWHLFLFFIRYHWFGPCSRCWFYDSSWRSYSYEIMKVLICCQMLLVLHEIEFEIQFPILIKFWRFNFRTRLDCQILSKKKRARICRKQGLWRRYKHHKNGVFLGFSM